MGTNTSMGCKDCKEKVEVGRKHYLLEGEYLKNFQQFLHRHLSCNLEFIIDDAQMHTHYKDYEDMPHNEKIRDIDGYILNEYLDEERN